MDLSSTVLALHEENFGPLSGAQMARMNALVQDYFPTSAEVPTWFSEALDCSLNRKKHKCLVFENTSDPSSLLVDLADDFGWNVDDDGEACACDFPTSKMTMILSREAVDENGRGCSKVTVAFL